MANALESEAIREGRRFLPTFSKKLEGSRGSTTFKVKLKKD